MQSAFTRPLIILYLGRIVASFGDWIYLVSLSLILADGNGTAITFMWLSKIIGVFLGKFVAGSVADRTGHKLTVIISDILRALLYILMPFFLQSPGLFVLVGGVSILGSFFSAAYTPLVTSLTNDNNRQRVNSIREVIGAAAVVLGPLLGAVLVLKGNFTPFIIVALSFIISALSFIFIPTSQPNNKNKQLVIQEKPGRSLFVLWSDLKFSFNFIRSNRAIFGITAATTILGLTSAMEVYEVLFVTKSIGLGTESFGLIVTINGIAFLLAGLLNTLWISKYPATIIYPIGMVIVVVMSILYAFSGNFMMLGISTTLMSMAIIITHTASDTICQTEIPVSVQGRVTSVQGILPEFASSLSTALSGFMLAFVSVRPIFIFVAFISVLGIPFSLLVLKKSTPRTKELAAEGV